MGEQSAWSAARILPVALWQRKGGIFLQPLRVSLLHFLVKFFRLVDRHLSLEVDLGALSWAGEFNVV